MTVCFLFVVSSRQNATQLTYELERDGYEVTIKPGDGEGLTFQVHARSPRRLAGRKIDRLVEVSLEPLAGRYGGTVAGWTREGRWTHEDVGIARLPLQW